MTLRLTWVVEYDANPADYEDCDGDPVKMAALDRESLDLGEMSLLDFIEGSNNTVSLTVEAVTGE